MRLLFSALLFITTAAQGGEAERVFEQVRGSMVIVTILDERNEIEGEGSGVVISAGKIITNCHVVRDAGSIRVTWADQTFPATLELDDTRAGFMSIAGEKPKRKAHQTARYKRRSPWGNGF